MCNRFLYSKFFSQGYYRLLSEIFFLWNLIITVTNLFVLYVFFIDYYIFINLLSILLSTLIIIIPNLFVSYLFDRLLIFFLLFALFFIQGTPDHLSNEHKNPKWQSHRRTPKEKGDGTSSRRAWHWRFHGLPICEQTKQFFKMKPESCAIRLIVSYCIRNAVHGFLLYFWGFFRFYGTNSWRFIFFSHSLVVNIFKITCTLQLSYRIASTFWGIFSSPFRFFEYIFECIIKYLQVCTEIFIYIL